MHKVNATPCRKCGGDTTINWVNPEESTGMDLKPLKKGGMKKSCLNCGFSEYINDLESNRQFLRNNKKEICIFQQIMKYQSRDI